MRWRIVLVVAALGSAGVFAFLLVRQGQPQAMVVSGFVEADQIRVGSRSGGRVRVVHVREGQRVAAGEALFEIEPFDLLAQQAEAQAHLAAMTAQQARLQAGSRPEELAEAKALRDRAAAVLQRLETGSRPEEIETARQKLAIAEANLALANVEFARLEQLDHDSAASKLERDRALRTVRVSQAEAEAARQELSLRQQGPRAEEVAEARATLAQAQAAWDLAKAGSRREDLDRASAEVASAQARVDATSARIAELVVRAPLDSVVDAMELRPGDLVNPNAPAVALLDTSSFWLRTYLPESMLGRVRIGSRVPVRLDARPGEPLSGLVSFIASEAEFTPRNVQTPEERSKQVFRVKLQLPAAAHIRVGMLADVLLDEVSLPLEEASVGAGSDSQPVSP